MASKSNKKNDNQSEYLHNLLFDYDAYDEKIFMPPPAQGSCSLQRIVRAKKTSVPSLETNNTYQNSDSKSPTSTRIPQLGRKMSDPDIHHGTSAALIDSTKLSESLSVDKNSRCAIVSSTPIVRPGRALINPFDPSHVTIKQTSYRRRWTHIFPKGPAGVLIQQHHYQAVPMTKAHTTNNTTPNNLIDTENLKELSIAESDRLSVCSSSFSKSFSSSHSEERNKIFKKPTTTTSDVPKSPAKSFLWGATGEQEWTPALTTGVDWKSLTFPACLPITTDYFPDKRSLHNDYLLSTYTLLPDAVNSDYANSRAVYRKPLTTEEVFKEIVAQRLAQGFQLIVLEDKGGKTTQNLSQGKTQQTAVGGMKPLTEETKEYLLSIGRIFHRITLTGSVITVTAYRPRHPYPPINVHYRYRFHAPQHENYEISGVNFKTEKLENFNWNYMDHYICTRGDVDYPLMESLKYRRYRMYMLPKENLAMNKIIELDCKNCDIYTDLAMDTTKQQVEDFLRFLEQHLNKLKRQFSRKPRDSPVAQSHLTRRRHSTSIISRNQSNQHVSRMAHRAHISAHTAALSNSLHNSATRTTIKTDRGRISPAADAATMSFDTESVQQRNDVDGDGFAVDLKFGPTATLQQIFEAMKHPETGVGFFENTQSLPSCTFTSYDALLWLKAKLDAGRNSLEVLESMRKEKLICHASGDWSKAVIPGFYLYYIAQQDEKNFVKPLNDLSAFENEWMEIEIQGCNHLWSNEPAPTNVASFLKNVPTSQSWTDYSVNKKIYRRSHLEFDVNQKSDRMEWGHVKYHTVMQPGYAFEIVVEWVTSSGPIVNDCLYGWTRRAQTSNYQLVPVPADPMAEPFTEKSDPLRGPIFIPLTTNFLETKSTLFEDYPEETRADRMLLFQEAILSRFGFLPCVIERKSSMNKDVPKEYQYIHCSGNMFVLIRCSKNDYQMESPSRQEANVTRCVYGHTNNTNIPKKVGFLWTWNHMIPNKKWKSILITNSADNELFQIKMLKDFRQFCANKDLRLLKFWQQSQELKLK